MKRMDGVERREPDSWMVERLRRWCEEWTIDQALAGMPGPDVPAGSETGAQEEPVTVPAGPLQVGCLALLAPRVSDTRRRPLHVLLIGAGDGPGVLCLPFGPYTEPATPGELLSGFDAPGLRVICLWNARRLASATELAGWIQDDISTEMQKRVRRAYASVSATGNLPADLVESGGPPLSHPDDPRRRYLREARQSTDRILGASRRSGTSYQQSKENIHARLRAAEDHDSYGSPDTTD